MNQMLLIKLGGSVITNKEKALTPNIQAIERLSDVLAKTDDSIIIVHGGGSFGHYWSIIYDMHTKPELYDRRGISVVHESMLALNHIIVKKLLDSGLNPYGISASAFFADGKVNSKKVCELVHFARRGIIPVIFGDVVHIHEGRFSIISGDSLMTTIAKQIKPSRVIFTVNVDGVYENMVNKKLVKVLNYPTDRITVDEKPIDVTGGMNRKISEAFEIAGFGINVHIVNGLDTERVFDVLRGHEFKGTTIPAMAPRTRS